ncbi:hypothetical protein LR48_Vigan02g101200 [Vigna angularis]|uniref:Transposase (putative) gypsy type domain-containing protein n=1 Tax=Phaseolus angularis TaxID=3914 RepID=A0A0L9TWQ9_PHAAN|nr:hypothetical protein LR48_Vigan02g101200 [Vigna angularis]
MAAVHIESSSESSGGVRGGRRGVMASTALLLAPHRASLYASAYGTRDLLEWRVNRTHIVRDVEDSRLVRAGVSLKNERVYYGKRSTSPDDFFYMYVNVFAQLFVRVPFTEFQMAVLREANVAPAQLHPNSWVVVQAFLAMCLAVGVTPMIPVFFHYFEVRPPPHGGWVSLTSVRDRTLFCSYSDSFKNFKHHYFKIIIDAAGRHEFHDAAGNPLFPFYWTRKPRKIKAFPVGVLNPVDLEAVRTINALPRRISACHLVEYLRHADCERKAFDLMTAPTPANPTSWPPGKESRKAHRQPGRRSSPDDFFYMYVNVFTQLFVRVPFIEFQMVVLLEANVAPTQLNPNSWAVVQAFLAMCLAVGVTPTIPVFFLYFEVRPPPHSGWVSLTSVRDRTFFRPFSDSFKNFKNNYFKVIIDAVGRHEFHDAEGNPLFPFYWTREPQKIRAFPVKVLGPADLEAVRTINALPHRISPRYLVECLCLEDCEQKAFHLMTTPTPRQSNFMASRKRVGANSSSAWTRVAPNAPCPPPVRRSSSSGRLPPVLLVQPQQTPQVEVAGGSIPVNRGPGPDPLSGLAAVLVDSSSEAATASVAPLVRKRKDPAGEGRKDKEVSSSRSASKKARKGKEKVPSAPLPGGIFSSAFSMSDRTKFHMSSSQRALIEPLSEGELTNAMLEMSTRTASLAWYLKEFADRRGADDVRTELLAEQKNSASLQLTMEQLLLTQDDYNKKIEQLEADLEKAKGESADAKDRLAVVRGDHERLLEECSQLKTKVSRQRSSQVGLLKTNQALTDDLTKARERIAELEAGIVFEHEEGFNKALCHASILAGIQEPFALGFDIKKDVFDGVLVDLNSLVDDEGPGTEGPSSAAGAAEAVEVEDDDEEDCNTQKKI